MSRWYRAYEGTVSDDKIAEAALISEASRSVAIATWHAVLESAAATQDHGRFETTARRVAAILGERPAVIEAVFAAFEEVGLVCQGVIVAWKRRQFESDNSTERSRRHRATSRNGDATLQQQHATPPYTDTDTEDTSSLRSEVSTNSLRSLERVSAQTASTESEDKPKCKAKRGTRLHADWTPSDEERSYGLALGIPEPALRRQFESFRDYWSAKAGAGGVKLDWPATLRNWLRRYAEEKGFAPPEPKPTGVPSSAGAFWPGPGYPTHEELLAKHSKPKVSDDATADGCGRDASGTVLADGGRVHRPMEARGPELGKGNQAGGSGMARLGDLLPFDRLAAGGDADGRERFRSVNDRPLPVAGMAGR